jgi:cytochrome c-type biogenesis protein CcmH
MRSALRSDQAGRGLFFAIAAIAALGLAVPFSMWLAQTPTGMTQADRLGAEIGCVCGTCPLRPIATCGCGFADGMLARLDEEISAGHSDDEIMITFVAEYGASIKIKPEGTGLGLMAWLAPMALLMVGAVVMAGVISHWRTQQPTAAAPADAHSPSNISNEDHAPAPEQPPEADRYRDLVERELDAFED